MKHNLELQIHTANSRNRFPHNYSNETDNEYNRGVVLEIIS